MILQQRWDSVGNVALHAHHDWDRQQRPLVRRLGSQGCL
jgi:hypothetical protein